jgi:5-methylcytosine-specific restriction protein A
MPTKSKGLGHLYDTARWQRLRQHQLQIEPLCAFCRERGIVTPATIADHVTPHRGDINKFWLGKLQSLCLDCHSNAKQFQENRGFMKDVGADGFPIDPNHPFNRF